MRLTLIAIILLMALEATFGQITYEPGYFISNDGKSTKCQIKNLDWKSNPTTFEYRIDGTEGKGDIETVSEFGITGGSVFSRFAVNIDRSSNEISSLTKYRNPEFKQETLFLRLLVNGKAILYMYDDQGLVRFFYGNNGSDLSQLVYKRYIQTGGHGFETGYAVENEQYKQTLFNELKCASISQRDIEKLKYERGVLMKLFNRYNECTGSAVKTTEVESPKSQTHISLLAGVGFNNLSSQFAGDPVTNYESAVALRVGAELEIVLPFNKGMWAVSLQPVYQTYSTQDAPGTIKVNYSSLDIGVGVRRYLFIKDQNSLYASLGGVFAMPIPSKETFKSTSVFPFSIADSLESSSSVNLVAGIGYRVSKFSAELSYGFDRNILQNGPSWTAPYGGVIVTLAYRLK